MHGSKGSHGADRAVRWVDRDADLAQVATEVAQGPLAVDTEADSFHHYREKICLIQLSFGDADVLIDPLAEIDTAVLQPLLGAPDVRKVLHAADYDVRLLDRDCGLHVNGLFDTMLAARLVGERAFGLAALLQKYVGVRLDKKFQRADWSARPLPAELVRYAALDTRFLTELAQILEAKLEESGRRTWAEEEFRRVEGVRWSSAGGVREPWLRLKGVASLRGREIAVARAMAALRETTAARRDVPLFRVMRDAVVLELARAAPRNVSELGTIRELPRSWKRGPGAAKILEAVAEALELPADDWPTLPRSEGRKRPTPEEEARLRRVCRERDRIAAGLDLEPSVIASRAVLERVLAVLDSGGDPADEAELRSWQLGLLQPIFEESL